MKTISLFRGDVTFSNNNESAIFRRWKSNVKWRMFHRLNDKGDNSLTEIPGCREKRIQKHQRAKLLYISIKLISSLHLFMGAIWLAFGSFESCSWPMWSLEMYAIQHYVIKFVIDLLQFSPSTPVSSTNKIDRHDITEILLKVSLNTIYKYNDKTPQNTNKYKKCIYSQTYKQ
jgi:hypothetical protein